jgi:hypothetical protein
LATIATRHVAGGTAEFSPRFRPVTGAGTLPPQLTSSYRHQTPSSSTAKPTASNKFERAIFRRYEQEIEYSTSAYAETLRTYSATQALPPSVREGLIDCITTLINQR